MCLYFFMEMSSRNIRFMSNLVIIAALPASLSFIMRQCGNGISLGYHIQQRFNAILRPRLATKSPRSGSSPPFANSQEQAFCGRTTKLRNCVATASISPLESSRNDAGYKFSCGTDGVNDKVQPCRVIT